MLRCCHLPVKYPTFPSNRSVVDAESIRTRTHALGKKCCADRVQNFVLLLFWEQLARCCTRCGRTVRWCGIFLGTWALRGYTGKSIFGSFTLGGVTGISIGSGTKVVFTLGSGGGWMTGVLWKVGGTTGGRGILWVNKVVWYCGVIYVRSGGFHSFLRIHKIGKRGFWFFLNNGKDVANILSELIFWCCWWKFEGWWK